MILYIPFEISHKTSASGCRHFSFTVVGAVVAVAGFFLQLRMVSRLLALLFSGFYIFRFFVLKTRTHALLCTQFFFSPQLRKGRYLFICKILFDFFKTLNKVNFFRFTLNFPLFDYYCIVAFISLCLLLLFSRVFFSTSLLSSVTFFQRFTNNSRLLNSTNKI